MRNFVIAATLLRGLALLAGDELLPPPGGVFTQAEWQEIYGSKRCTQDYAVLSDGAKLCGRIMTIPSLSYSFGAIDFDTADVALVSLVPKGNSYKLQYITRDGQSYVGTIGKGRIVIHLSEPTEQNPDAVAVKEIDPKSISFILLIERGPKKNPSDHKISSIELRGGDVLPARILTDPITLTDGRNEKNISPDAILDITFNGGIHGQILEKGERVDLGFLFVKEQFLTALIPHHGQTVRLPWDQIEGIQGHNGGFKQDLSAPMTVLSSRSADELETILQSGVQSTAPDSIGKSKGILLVNAAGASILPAKAFEGLELLGMEQLSDPLPMFDPEEENAWEMEIAFEEIPPQEDMKEVAVLDPKDLEAVEETTVFEAIEKVDVDPEPFDVVALQDDMYEPDNNYNALTPEALARIEEILDEDDLDDYDFAVAWDGGPILTEHAQGIIDEILEDDALVEVAPIPHYGLGFDSITQFEPIQEPEEELDFVSEIESIQEPQEKLDANEVIMDEEKAPLENYETFLHGPQPDEFEGKDESLAEIPPPSQPEHIEEMRAPAKELLLDDVSINLDEELTPEESSLLNQLFAHKPRNTIREVSADRSVDRMVYISPEDLWNVPYQVKNAVPNATVIPTKGMPTLLIKAPAFFVDRKPVSNSEYERFIMASGQKPPIHWVGNKIPLGLEHAPVVNVSYQDAEAYAAWVGKRLLTELEWGRVMKNSVLTPLSDLGEWTCTVPLAGRRLVVSPLAAHPMKENLIDHMITFRTAKD